MAKKKTDQLSMIGLSSAIMRHLSQQRSLEKARLKREARPRTAAEKAEAKKARKAAKAARPKDTRSPEQIRADVDATRAKLGKTVDRLSYDLDVPARARDARARLLAVIPESWKGDRPAAVVGATVLASGLGIVAALSSATAPRAEAPTGSRARR